MLRFFNKGTQLLCDVVVLSLAIWLAFELRFDFDLPDAVLFQASLAWPPVVALQYGVLYAFGVPKCSWRFFSLRDAQRTVLAFGLSASVLVVLRLTLARAFAGSHVIALPLSVIAMNFALASWSLIGLRMVRRLVAERSGRRPDARHSLPHVIIGAGQAGALVARELGARPHLSIRPVAFLDDDPMKIGTRVHGLPVAGPVNSLAQLCRRLRVRHAIIALGQAPRERMRAIVRICKEAGIATKIIPSLDQIVSGQKQVSEIREVDIEDLLGRCQVDLDASPVLPVLSDRTVLVTGAGGSIGSELCRQVMRFRPRKLLLCEHNENALFHIHRELEALRTTVEIVPWLGSILDAPRMMQLFSTHSPHVVLHAAAHKHVPMVEWNPGEAIKNNIFGTQLIADLADRHGVLDFVTISTDKAVNPTSVMGATKRVAEIYTQALSRRSNARFVAVRFGNVLGSAGSVVPIFQEQIRRGGPVTVTDPDMRRYFMTIREACQLTLRAAALGKGGEIFVLDMGEPVRIVDLARDLITLSGFEPEVDIPVVFTGRRPGEKLFEELSVASEQADRTHHPRIFVGRIAPCPMVEVQTGMRRLHDAAIGGDRQDMLLALAELVPEFCPDELYVPHTRQKVAG